MPELARFYGIVIRMFWESDAKHHRPHFHVEYQEHLAVFACDQIELLSGDLPLRQRRMVEAWAYIHQEESLDNWARLRQGRSRRTIDPLR